MTVLAFVAVVAIEVRAALPDVDAESREVVELLGAAVDVVVALQVLADRFWVLAVEHKIWVVTLTTLIKGGSKGDRT